MEALRGAALAAAAFLWAWPVRAAEPATPIPVQPLAKAPTVDGNLSDWGSDGWTKVPLQPAVSREDRTRFGLEGEDRNTTGKMTLQIKAGVAEGRLFVAARWPDDGADAEYRGWEWSGVKYVEGKKRDDMFALRFHLDGDYDRSMLSGRTYRVDLWLWSAARTNPAGFAEDWIHAISAKPIEDAAEYEVKDVGTVYIKKYRDAGSPIYKAIRSPKEKGADRSPSFELTGNASGSLADVTAKGAWKGGFWHLELSRRLDTGHGDDIAFRPGRKVLGQAAVFNRNSDENKSVSDTLLFDFSQIR